MSVSSSSASLSNPQRLSQALRLLNEYLECDEADDLFFQNRFVRWQRATLTAHDVRHAVALLEKHTPLMAPVPPQTAAEAA